MDFFQILSYILSGAFVGLLIGLTGVGGGSLMTPILLKFGFPANIAIGTDLLYAAITKSGAVYSHYKLKTIRWKIVGLFCAGSLPASLWTAYILKAYFPDANSYKDILTTALGIMLILTATMLLFKKHLQNLSSRKDDTDVFEDKRSYSMNKIQAALATHIAGWFLGVFVTLSSVGAGAFGTAVLLIIFHRLPTIKIIGTELAHAVPLTLVAGLGHMFLLNNVDFTLLACLLIGSLPATQLGTKFSKNLPEQILQQALACILLLLGLNFTFPALFGGLGH